MSPAILSTNTSEKSDYCVLSSLELKGKKVQNKRKIADEI